MGNLYTFDLSIRRTYSKLLHFFSTFSVATQFWGWSKDYCQQTQYWQCFAIFVVDIAGTFTLSLGNWDDDQFSKKSWNLVPVNFVVFWNKSSSRSKLGAYQTSNRTSYINIVPNSTCLSRIMGFNHYLPGKGKSKKSFLCFFSLLWLLAQDLHFESIWTQNYEIKSNKFAIMFAMKFVCWISPQKNV